MAKNPYDDRRSTAQVFVNSTFILQEFKRNLSKGFYGDQELKRLTKKMTLELWRRNPALLEELSKIVAQKYGDYVKREYGSANFRKKLFEDANNRKQEKIRRENERQLRQLQDEILNEQKIAEIVGDTMFSGFDENQDFDEE